MQVEVDVDVVTVEDLSEAVYTAVGCWRRSCARDECEIQLDVAFAASGRHAWWHPLTGSRVYVQDARLAAEATQHRIARAILDGQFTVIP